MSKLLKQALFIIPIAAIVSAPVALDLKNINAQPEIDSYATTKSSQNISIFPSMNPFNVFNEKRDYAMSEPFANSNAMANSMGMTYSMRKSMDPNTWMQMMTNMMKPYATSPVEMCASCHQGEDLARYQKQFGPMMQSSWNQYQTMMDPHAMGAIMNPAMMNQMMHQMMTIPMQMMMPMMNGGPGMNLHMGMPINPSASVPKMMDPKQYAEWYNEQQKKLDQSK